MIAAEPKRVPGTPRRDGTVFFVGAVATAGAAAFELANGHSVVAALIAVMPFAVWELARLSETLVVLGLSLPFVMSLTSQSSSVNVAPSDLVLAFAFAGVSAIALASRNYDAFRALRPARLPLTIYGAFLLLLLTAHFGSAELVQTAQRYELFLVPAIVGAYAAVSNKHVQILVAYVVSSSVFAVVWPFHSFGIQKNPAGQVLANAILLLVAFERLRRFTPCFLALVPGLLATQSRGAVGALVIGLIVIAVTHPSRRRIVRTRIAPATIVAFVAFALLSPAVRNRLTTFSSSGSSSADYSIHIRHQYTHDAKALISEHPWLGVGVGNYQAGSPTQGTGTTDPHDVVLLQAAEGGFGLAGAFVLLVAGITALPVRARDVDLAPAAAAVFTATVIHGLVDVYWVRGTPVLSWMLVGMVCGLIGLSRKNAES